MNRLLIVIALAACWMAANAEAGGTSPRDALQLPRHGEPTAQAFQLQCGDGLKAFFNLGRCGAVVEGDLDVLRTSPYLCIPPRLNGHNALLVVQDAMRRHPAWLWASRATFIAAAMAERFHCPQPPKRR